MWADRMPPREFRTASGEWSMVQEAIHQAVSASMVAQRESFRDEMKEFRTEVRQDFDELKDNDTKIQAQLSAGNTMFQLLEQRLEWVEGGQHNRADGDTTKINRAIAAAMPLEPRTGKSERSLISQKVINAVILAFAAAMGASIWAFVEHALSDPKPAPPSRTEATTTPTVSPHIDVHLPSPTP